MKQKYIIAYTTSAFVTEKVKELGWKHCQSATPYKYLIIIKEFETLEGRKTYLADLINAEPTLFYTIYRK